ncbi:hypothetical protein [Microbacterium maritypicum]
MKKMLTAVTALALLLSLGSCAAPLSEDATQPAERPVATSPAPEATPDATGAAAPVGAPEPPVEAVPVPTLTINAVEPMAFATTLDPPTLSGVFEIRDAEHGYLADTERGPRFLLAHATSPGRAPAPGNLWQELAVGDRIEALGSSWSITERVEASKSWPTDDAALVQRTYGADPGTLVLITCVPRWEGRATHNLINIAEEAS